MKRIAIVFTFLKYVCPPAKSIARPIPISFALIDINLTICLS